MGVIEPVYRSSSRAVGRTPTAVLNQSNWFLPLLYRTVICRLTLRVDKYLCCVTW